MDFCTAGYHTVTGVVEEAFAMLWVLPDAGVPAPRLVAACSNMVGSLTAYVHSQGCLWGFARQGVAVWVICSLCRTFER